MHVPIFQGIRAWLDQVPDGRAISSTHLRIPASHDFTLEASRAPPVGRLAQLPARQCCGAGASTPADIPASPCMAGGQHAGLRYSSDRRMRNRRRWHAAMRASSAFRPRADAAPRPLRGDQCRCASCMRHPQQRFRDLLGTERQRSTGRPARSKSRRHLGGRAAKLRAFRQRWQVLLGRCRRAGAVRILVGARFANGGIHRRGRDRGGRRAHLCA